MLAIVREDHWGVWTGVVDRVSNVENECEIEKRTGKTVRFARCVEKACASFD